MYRVIKEFADKQDNRYTYKTGDIFPREGVIVSEERLAELSSDANRRGEPLIQEIIEEAPEAVEEEENTEPAFEEVVNPPEEIEEKKAEAPKKRGRKKNAANTD